MNKQSLYNWKDKYSKSEGDNYSDSLKRREGMNYSSN